MVTGNVKQISVQNMKKAVSTETAQTVEKVQ